MNKYFTKKTNTQTKPFAKSTVLGIKMLFLLLFMVMGWQQVKAQTTCTVSGITITATGDNTDIYYAPNSQGSCPLGNSFTGNGGWTGSPTTGTLTYTFSAPVLSATVSYTAINGDDVGSISINGGGTMSLTNPCNVSVSGNVLTSTTGPSNIYYGTVWITVTSTVPFTAVTVTNIGGNTGWIQGNLCDFSLVGCKAGTTAPTLSGTTATNTCPATTANLNSLVTSTTPTGASLVWFTNNTHTGAAYATPTAATAGTYYAFYYDATNTCYSPASAAVTVTITPTNTVTAGTTTTRCINTALPSITHTTTGATGIGAATGLPAGVTAAWAGNTLTISGTPTASGTFNYSIPLTGGCGTVNATGTIVVTAANTVTAGTTTTSCISTALPSITHTTTGATGIGAATGLPAGVTAAWAGNTLTISGTPTAAGTFNYSIPLTGGCGTVNATGTIVINPVPSITSIVPNCTSSTLNSVTVNATVSSGTLEYSSNGGSSFQSNNTFTGLTNGTSYTFVVRTVGSTCTVTQPFTPNCTATPLVANNDNFSATPISSGAGGTTASVFGNDTYNNGAGGSANSTNVTLTTQGTWPAGITINTTTGVISVAPGTPAGTYNLTYRICEIANPSNCSTSTVTLAIANSCNAGNVAPILNH